jgi:short subunit dehydrogenase-like uncharacterized protein
MPDWMLYGATGYTGQLVAEEAIRRGHRPLLAGRSAEKLRPLAERLGLEWVAVALDDAEGLAEAVSRVKLVYHAAGPFVQTSAAMVRACLKAGAHYLDITGEIPVYQQVFAYDAAARERGIALIPGVGFDVIPSDCLLKYVAHQLPDADQLIVALDALGTAERLTGRISAGTANSMLELIAQMGIAARRDGKLTTLPFGYGARRFTFTTGQKAAMPIPWGDLEIGWRTTGIPNITTYLTFPPSAIEMFRVAGPLMRGLLQSSGLRGFLRGQISRMLSGPDEGHRQTGRSALYAQVRNPQEETRQAWLETAEGYQFTALAAPLVVEQVLAGNLRGATTPALALGADFVLSIPGTRRLDSLPTD